MVAAAGLHTSQTAPGTWQIPERLQHIPEAEDPNFFNMVEYYFHKACILSEDNLVIALNYLSHCFNVKILYFTSQDKR